MDRQGAVAELRAVVAAFATEFLDTGDRWCVALSGGPDSLALTGVAATILPTTALIVDHRLPSGGPVTAARSPRPAPPDTQRWRMPVATGPFCWPTLSTTRPRRCCSALAAARVPGRSPACAATIRPGAGRCWRCGAR